MNYHKINSKEYISLLEKRNPVDRNHPYVYDFLFLKGKIELPIWQGFSYKNKGAEPEKAS